MEESRYLLLMIRGVSRERGEGVHLNQAIVDPSHHAFAILQPRVIFVSFVSVECHAVQRSISVSI